jgi:hypothetical protein
MHHIIPQSIGGDNSTNNKVWLTAEEHVKVHILLTKMVYKEDHIRKMHIAAVRMITPQNIGREREILLEDILKNIDISELNNIKSESARLHSEYMSKKFLGKNNPFYGKTNTEESNKSRRDKQLGIPKNHSLAISSGRLKVSDHISALVTGTNNPRYNPSCYEWENIKTGEKRISTRLEMINMDPSLKSNISSVITGNSSHVKGWKIIKKCLTE